MPKLPGRSSPGDFGFSLGVEAARHDVKMSTKTDQITLHEQQVEQIDAPEDISGIARVLWIVGRSDQFTDTETELREVCRRADEQGLLCGGE